MLQRLKSSLVAGRQLGPLEDEVLRVLWTRGDATVRELIDDSAVDGAYTTIMTTLDRLYIGRTFCVVVMAGLGSITGTLIASIILGVSETIVLTMFGASWAPAISFALLLGVLAVRPQGLFGR